MLNVKTFRPTVAIGSRKDNDGQPEEYSIDAIITFCL